MADEAERDQRDAGSMWYQLGYALERTRARAPSRLRPLGDRRTSRGRKDAEPRRRRPARGEADHRRDGGPGADGDALDALFAAGAGTAALRLLDLWPARRRPGVLGLVRAGVAGAGAALLRELLRPVLEGGRPELDEELAGAVAAGAARGLVYASVVEPRLGGSALVRGALYGGIEYAVSPWGGLTRVLGRKAPFGRVLSGLFEDYDAGDDTLADHVAFAVALAVLYGGAGDEESED